MTFYDIHTHLSVEEMSAEAVELTLPVIRIIPNSALQAPCWGANIDWFTFSDDSHRLCIRPTNKNLSLTSLLQAFFFTWDSPFKAFFGSDRKFLTCRVQKHRSFLFACNSRPQPTSAAARVTWPSPTRNKIWSYSFLIASGIAAAAAAKACDQENEWNVPMPPSLPQYLTCSQRRSIEWLADSCCCKTQATPLQPSSPRVLYAQPIEHLSLCSFQLSGRTTTGSLLLAKVFGARSLQYQYRQSFDSSTFLLPEIQIWVQAFINGFVYWGTALSFSSQSFISSEVRHQAPSSATVADLKVPSSTSSLRTKCLLDHCCLKPSDRLCFTWRWGRQEPQDTNSAVATWSHQRKATTSS